MPGSPRRSMRLDLPSDYGVDDIPLIVQDRVIDGSGRLVYPLSMHARMMGVRGSRIFVNGTENAVFDAQTGQLRLRILNGSNARLYDFSLEGDRSMQLIASDGGLLDRSHIVRSVRLAPGERAQVIIDLSEGRPLRLLASSPENAMGMMGGRGMMGGGMMGRGDSGDASADVFQILDIRPASSAQRIRVPTQLASLGA